MKLLLLSLVSLLSVNAFALTYVDSAVVCATSATELNLAISGFDGLPSNNSKPKDYIAVTSNWSTVVQLAVKLPVSISAPMVAIPDHSNDQYCVTVTSKPQDK